MSFSIILLIESVFHLFLRTIQILHSVSTGEDNVSLVAFIYRDSYSFVSKCNSPSTVNSGELVFLIFFIFIIDIVVCILLFACMYFIICLHVFYYLLACISLFACMYFIICLYVFYYLLVCMLGLLMSI